jgi:hypothetical protein
MTDWLKILDEQERLGLDLARQVPATLANPDIEAAQVKVLFKELEKQADFADKLRQALEAMGHDFKVVDKAAALEERYADLAASAAERLKGLLKQAEG